MCIIWKGDGLGGIIYFIDFSYYWTYSMDAATKYTDCDKAIITAFLLDAFVTELA